jgi:CRISPR-associated endonuclease/helicase Cas3
MEKPKYFYLWAKTDKSGGTENTHPLIYHMLDVGTCTLALWNLALSEQTRRTFANFLKLETEAAGRLLAFWASLHDIGKAAPGFQRKYLPVLPSLKVAGFTFPEPTPKPAPHGQVSAWALETLLSNIPGHTAQVSKMIARAVGGHHGTWPQPSELQALARQIGDTGDETWRTARIEIVQAVRGVFNPPDAFRFPANQKDENALLTLFSGLVSVADWIGSMAEYFPFEPHYYTPQEYGQQSAKLAEEALHRLGWIGWQADGQLHSFTQMFPSFSPRPAQQAVFDAAENLPQPALLILEAPTGSGKTETALFLADTWLQTNLGHGIYIAMPTQATSNQMFGRVNQFLSSRYPQEAINYHLVHGGALLADKDFETNPIDIADDESAPQAGSIRAQGWFLPRKRTLLAPFGVGTVDQALMSVLQTRHFFVRMFGLGHKILVFDEVHAYDTYMSTLFERLLAWLRTIGTSVILLSATLPESTRQKLAAAWLGQKQVDLPQADYPRLTVVTGGQARTVLLPAPETRSLALSWIDGEPEKLAEHLAGRLEGGGCAAIICNRVARAQEVYHALKTAGIVEPVSLILFHARFPFAWREAIEKRVLEMFSKDRQRPEKAVVVATQVIEQSLDLDFDYMITDLAPIDLLIQRAGRLHRHSQNNIARPELLKHPVMAISQPIEIEGLPDFGRDERVYERAVLLRTWLALRERTSLALPQEISDLIESVYGKLSLPEDPAMARTLAEAEDKAQKERIGELVEAKKRLIPTPDDEELLYGRNEGLEEDDTRVHKAFRALTRMAEPGVSLICLHRAGDGLSLEPDSESGRIDLDKKPNRQQTRELLRYVVTIQRHDIVDYFANQGEHPAWKEVAALRYHYPVIFDEDGLYHLEGTSLTLFLSRETGLEIRKETA